MKVLQCRNGLHQKNSPSRKSICPIETGGEFLPDGSSISLVRDSNTDCLKILIAGGTNDVTDSMVEYAGRTYVPPDLSEPFQSAIVFPEQSRDFASTAALFTGTKESIMDFGLPEQAVLIAVYFLLSSWLVEILPAAPFLLISGPRAQASLLLALVSCLVTRALTESFSRRIHGLARQLDVASVQEGKRMCSQYGESPLGYGKNDVVNH